MSIRGDFRTQELPMRVGLFTYHDESSTAAYLRSAITAYGDTVVRLGLNWLDGSLPAEGLDRKTATGGLDALLFVDQSGPFWPAGVDEVRSPTAAYRIDTHQKRRAGGLRPFLRSHLRRPT
jgi:hypothetical protein